MTDTDLVGRLERWADWIEDTENAQMTVDSIVDFSSAAEGVNDAMRDAVAELQAAEAENKKLREASGRYLSDVDALVAWIEDADALAEVEPGDRMYFEDIKNRTNNLRAALQAEE